MYKLLKNKNKYSKLKLDIVHMSFGKENNKLWKEIKKVSQLQ